MNPWILVLMLVSFATAAAVGRGLAVLVAALVKLHVVRRDSKVPLEVGQTWCLNDRTYRVDRKYDDDGTYGIYSTTGCGSVSFGTSQDEWTRRVLRCGIRLAGSKK